MVSLFQAPEIDGEKFISRIWKRFPRWMRTFAIIFFVLGGFIIFLDTATGHGKSLWQKIVSSDSICDHSQRSFTSKFETSELCIWDGIQGLQFTDHKQNIVRPIISENFLGGRDIFFPVLVSSNFQTAISFTPLNPEKINVAFNYGYIWRIIIGNGDYNQVVMQRNQNIGKRNLAKHDWVDVLENNDMKWIKPNGRLDSKKEITVSIVSRPREGTRVVHINATVSGYIDGAIQKKDFDFDYNVETAGLAASLTERVGVGFLDPFNEGIETQLTSFELDKL